MGNELQNASVVGRNTDLVRELTTVVDTDALLLQTGTLPQYEHLAHPKDAAAALMVGQLQAASQEYPDSRPGVAAHPAVRFDLQLSPGESEAAFLAAELGPEDATQLISDWVVRGVDLEGNVPEHNSAVLFQDSNNKARNRDSAPRGAKTTQQEDLEGAGLKFFADDREMTNICAKVVGKARRGESLSAEEQDLYRKLRCGVVSCCSGALYVGGNGRLRANDCNDDGYSGRWAAAAPLASESKI